MRMLRSSLLALLTVSLCRIPAAAQGAAAPHVADPTDTQVGVDVLSDRGGVDLNPYLEHLVDAVNRRWRPLLKEADAKAISGERQTVIGITILPGGKLDAMHVDGSAHNAALDKAAREAVKQSTFAPPPTVRDRGLRLRLHFIVH